MLVNIWPGGQEYQPNWPAVIDFLYSAASPLSVEWTQQDWWKRIHAEVLTLHLDSSSLPLQLARFCTMPRNIFPNTGFEELILPSDLAFSSSMDPTVNKLKVTRSLDF